VETGETILEVKDLKVQFRSKERFDSARRESAGNADVGTANVIRAVDGVSFGIRRGEVLGLVGESGCGKSTVCRAILRLIPIASGEVRYEGSDLASLSENRMRLMRKRMQMVFQDPYASLNPSMTVYQAIAELLMIHRVAQRKAWRRKVLELLQEVELDSDFIDRYPHELSGGQRQRVCIARALAVKPEFLAADEPVSSLDVSVQAQIINLLQELQEKLGLTFLFISHDLSVVRHITERIAIMYLGKIVEIARTKELYDNPLHPYSQALLSAVPIPDPEVENSRKRIILAGEVPSAYDIPKGCRFNTRCWRRMDICFTEEPELKEGSGGHRAACWLY
jgi:oligopeptide transport system ATP-binding protein